MSQIALISGSPAKISRSALLLDEAGRRLARAGHQLLRIEVRELPPAALLAADANNEAIARCLAGVTASDAVLIATPVYKASYSGLLKIFLDLLPQKALDGKPVLPIATGGSLAHLLSLDYALKPVLAALGAAHTLPNIFGTDQDIVKAEDGSYRPHPYLIQRLEDSLQQLTRHLDDHRELRWYRQRFPRAYEEGASALADEAA